MTTKKSDEVEGSPEKAAFTVVDYLRQDDGRVLFAAENPERGRVAFHMSADGGGDDLVEVMDSSDRDAVVILPIDILDAGVPLDSLSSDDE